MSKLNIKLSISDRLYPMKVNVSDEEVMRKSALLINQKIKDFSQKYAVKDNQDLLAMCALSFAVELHKCKQKHNLEKVNIEKQLNGLESVLESVL
tara:strand:- start:508 stop:792 length:285 start_codon:yes stop_codon:yes gene_type:complete